MVHVGQDKRLDYRVIDLRTAANQAIFRVQCEVENVSLSAPETNLSKDSYMYVCM